MGQSLPRERHKGSQISPLLMSFVTCPFHALGVPRAGERFPRVLQGLPTARQSSLGSPRGPEVLWVRSSSCGLPRLERSTTFYCKCSTFPEPLLYPAPGTGPHEGHMHQAQGPLGQLGGGAQTHP